ncbi:hypothetical protein ACFV9E_11785 [Streptomyces sp. NPDC059835]|uniref:hypothetical protein n=1 Tax=Streptomyces sp. NPDC059835 TaxID=3346967 RepID=UPI0036604AB1
MSSVLRVDADGAVTVLPWPDDLVQQGLLIRAGVGGQADTGAYHRRAVLHVHGNGQGEGLPMNLAAWVLACVWREVELPYGLYGVAVVTGPQSRGLDSDLAAEVRAVCKAVADVRVEWQYRPPAGEASARAELLAAARHAWQTLRTSAI